MQLSGRSIAREGARSTEVAAARHANPYTAGSRQTSAMTRALVLSGGASLGAIEVGMLQALFERGVAPELIVGTLGRRAQRCVHRLARANRANRAQARRDLAEAAEGKCVPGQSAYRVHRVHRRP